MSHEIAAVTTMLIVLQYVITVANLLLFRTRTVPNPSNEGFSRL